MPGKVKIIVYRLGQEPVVEEIEDNFRAMQGIVGGYLSGHYIAPDLQIMCHDEGKLIRLPPNRWVPRLQDAICGDFFVSRHDGAGETVDVTAADVGLCGREILPLESVGFKNGVWGMGRPSN
jgi:hypothetical protein